jgi:hypothetical protein
VTRPLSTNPSAIRKRRYRERQRRQVGVAAVEYDAELLDHLVALGVLTDAETLDPHRVGAALTWFVRAAPKKVSTRPVRESEVSLDSFAKPSSRNWSKPGSKKWLPSPAAAAVVHEDLCPACGRPKPKVAA